MKKPKLNLDTELGVRQYGGSEIRGKIKVLDFLAELQREFPDGFIVRDATQYLRGAIRGIIVYGNPYGWGHLNHTRIYRALQEEGYLESQPAPPKDLRKGGTYRFYTFRGDFQSGTGLIATREFEVPGDLLGLLQGYKTLMGIQQSVSELVIGALESRILNDQSFLKNMERMKQQTPSDYTKMGGAYLDKLLQARASTT